MPGELKTNLLVAGLLRLMGLTFRLSPARRAWLKGVDGWMDFCVGVKTKDDALKQHVRFQNGFVKAGRGIPEDADAVLCFKNADVARRMLEITPEEVMDLMLQNQLSISGNLAIVNKFNFFLSLLLQKKHRAMREKRAGQIKAETSSMFESEGKAKTPPEKTVRLKAEKTPEAPYLDDPYLSDLSLDDFPRLTEFLNIHHTHKPAICRERPKIMTDWFRENGYEADSRGEPWIPALRQGHAFKRLMETRRPILRKNDLLAGTTTAEEIGVVLYPDTHASMIWGELFSVPERMLNPYDVSEETRRTLHFDVFPYWEKRNIREWVRSEYGEPLCQQLDERFAVYFIWKTVAISHTIPDFPKLLKLGTGGMIEEIETELAKANGDVKKRHVLEAMILCLKGLEAYAANLAAQVVKEAKAESDPKRKKELEQIAGICSRVPREPAKTLHEALQSMWIAWVGLHMENTNAGLSLGRLDRWLQPYFEADIEKFDDPADRRAYVKRAVELAGCFFMRCTDHLPLIPDIGNFLFGGSSSDQAVTLGGVKPDGGDGVCDMTYVFLKVTEILGIRDPNVNARFNPEKNSKTYLRRLCETNLITRATPSMHNDLAVMTALAEFHYPPEHLRDWSATGCVEPTISGKHFGHTGNIMMNMVAALEMALRDGLHPLMDWKVGPATGDPAKENFASFEEFFAAFEKQYAFLIDQVCAYNDMLSKAHALWRPTPFLSSLIDGCVASGKDVTGGGARYNTTGMACIGLADVTDSLMTIKKMVFEEKSVGFGELIKALDDNFASNPALHARIVKKVPKFGSGSEQALEIANRVTRFTHDTLAAHRNYRGGIYTAGFWSMSNHVAFGCLSGALPSGREAGKPFTPGLTPQAGASDNLLDPIRDVARLDPVSMTNNIAFNVKLAPKPGEAHGDIVGNMFAYVKSYFDMGGMQMQFNVVGTDTLKDAMAHPEQYRNLLVRISGYNAYFVTLNRDMQLELIRRAEYGV